MSAMTDINRRDLLVGLSAITAVTAAQSQVIQTMPPTTTAGEPILDTPRVFPYNELPVKKNANGSETRPVLHGVLATGEAVEVHCSTALPGGVPNTPHKHRQSDIILIREGTVAFEHDGKSEHVGPGGVIFVASQTMHTLRNVGDVEAKYFVVIISRESNATLVNAR
jgi:mannose-6-phosphate isomerase-like protein (cupin superfamily)